MKIYDLIESVGRFELNKLRSKKEANRVKLFIEAFQNDTLKPS